MDRSVTLSRPHLDMDMVAMYEDAYKQQPANEELGQQTFFANARIGNWKAAQQVLVLVTPMFPDLSHVRLDRDQDA